MRYSWETVNLSTCRSLCISVHQQKHVASNDTHHVSSRSSSDKDCSAQGIRLSKIMEKKGQEKTDMTGKWECHSVDSFSEDMTWQMKDV